VELFERLDPEFRKVLEDGLASSEGKRWQEVVDALQSCTMGWSRYFEQRFAKDPVVIAWMTAAAHYECWASSANHTSWLKRVLENTPDIERKLSDLDRNPSPWIQRMSRWARRVLRGEDKWIGESEPHAP
jgi:hypothetical protein